MTSPDAGQAAAPVLRPSAWPLSRNRRMSLAFEDRTLTVTDRSGRRHQLPLGNEPGQILEIGPAHVLVDAGPQGEARRIFDCWAAVDLDHVPRLVLAPTDRWPAIRPWCDVHGIPGLSTKMRLHATPDTLMIDTSGDTNARVLAVLLVLVLAFLAVLTPAWTGVPFAAAAFSVLGLYLLTIAAIGVLSTRAYRADRRQLEALESLPTRTTPSWLTRPRPPRPSTGSRSGTGEEPTNMITRTDVVLRPDRVRSLRSTPYDRNVSLAVDGETLILTDQDGRPHAFTLGNQLGQVRSLDQCRWTRDEWPEQARGDERYLVGVDRDRTALFALMPLDRWHWEDVAIWCRVHGLTLSRSEELLDDERERAGAGRLLPKFSPTTLVVGTHERGYTYWLVLALAWAAAIVWLTFVAGLNIAAEPNDDSSPLELPLWLGFLPAVLNSVPTYLIARRELRADRAQARRLATWEQLVDPR